MLYGPTISRPEKRKTACFTIVHRGLVISFCERLYSPGIVVGYADTGPCGIIEAMDDYEFLLPVRA
jgi:hypothetical protein